MGRARAGGFWVEYGTGYFQGISGCEGGGARGWDKGARVFLGEGLELGVGRGGCGVLGPFGRACCWGCRI